MGQYEKKDQFFYQLNDMGYKGDPEYIQKDIIS